MSSSICKVEYTELDGELLGEVADYKLLHSVKCLLVPLDNLNNLYVVPLPEELEEILPYFPDISDEVKSYARKLAYYYGGNEVCIIW